MKALQRLALTMFLTVFLSIPLAVAAQQKQAAAEPTGLALEIVFYKDNPPAYLPVPPSEYKPGGAWFGRFRQVSDWKQPQGSLPVRAVNIVSRKEADAVRVSVSVFVGVKFHDKEEQVATYLIRENEKVTTPELAKFGVEPFEITVVRVPQSSAGMPSVVNNTSSLVIEGIEANNTTFPSYNLSLRNASSKNVVALQIEVLVDGKPRSSSQPMGKEGKPLIKAAGEFQTYVPGVKSAQMTRQGYMPESPRGQQILISAAVFEDGTYEGDPQIAARIRVRIRACKVQLGRIVSVLDNLKVAEVPNDPPRLEALKQQISNLNDDWVIDVEELLKDIPKTNIPEKSDLEPRIQAAMHIVKKDLLDEIDRFEKAHPESPDSKAFDAWLNTIRNRYKQWLSRL